MKTMLQGRASPAMSPVQLFDNLDLLTVEQLAEFLGKRPQTIRNWVARREVPFVPGRPVKFIRASIVVWLQEKEVKPCR